MFDLVLKRGRVIDPAQNLDRVCDIAFADGKVAALGDDLTDARETRDVAGLIVTPGLIDLHTHVYWGGTSAGVDPDAYAKPCGITTVVDAGTAGPGNIMGFRRHVIERSEVRILPFLNVAYPGIFALGKHIALGESADLRLLEPAACLEAARDHKDLIVGIKVRLGRSGSGLSGIAALDISLEVAEYTGLPLMTHLDSPPPSRREVMDRLRPGDILTHCYRLFPNTPVAPSGAVQQDVLRARERGVLFDIGHGKGSFGFATAVAMMKKGFMPDIISSDVHALSITGPAYNLVVTMSKFLALGWPLPEIIRAVTINAARAIRLEDRGTLRPGTLGDATVLTEETGEFVFEDVAGETINAAWQIAVKGAVLNGKWWA